MVNRVLLGQRGSDYGLWVSKPGRNVVTASQANLNFNSNFAAMGVHSQGEITVNFTNNPGSTSQTIPFGKTFPSPPFVTFERRTGSEYVKVGDLGGFNMYYSQDVYQAEYVDGEWIDEWVGWRYRSLSVRTTSSNIVINAEWDRPSGTPNTRPPSVTLRYSIYDFNL